MATILAPGMIVQCKAFVTELEQAAVMTWAYRVAGVGAPPATDQDLSDTVDTNIKTALKACLNNNATYNGILTQIVFPLPQPVSVQTTVGAGPGTAGANALPRQVSGLVSFYTSLAGRAQRGRLYVPFGSNVFLGSDGKPTAAYVTALTAFRNTLTATNILVGGRSATVAFGVYHRKTRTINDTVAYVTRAKFATQRRRGDFGHANASPF